MPAAPADASVLENYVDGMWVRPQGVGLLDVPDPSTGALLARVPRSGTAEVARAVAAARRAFPGWREVPVAERARRVLALRARLESESEALARSIVRENGKTLAEARGSVRRGIEAVEFAASAPTTMQGSFLEDVTPGVDTTLLRQPLGVVAGITPFNFPVMIPLWMAPLALVCGNAFVLKPSERVPLSAAFLARLIGEAGFPSGTFNLVHGDAAAVDALLAHPGIDAVSFVGSAPTARHVYESATASGKRVQALAGAKNHLLVLPDADLERAVPAIVSSAFGQSGERCLAGSVVVAVEPVGDPLVARLADAVRALRLGPADASATEVGPVIRADHRARVLRWIDEGVASGAVVAARGTVPAGGDGYFVAPVLFDRVAPEMSIAQEEIFGPVLSVIRVPSLDAAIEVANRARFGNAAAIFTRDGRSAREFTHRIEAGMLGVNLGVPAPPAFFPFVGWKGSFYGDLHATGRDAIEFYTRKKVVTSRWF
ncbi:MAG TPA: CoA-acylating methylmalonate-semialdehyde dehydrogenase [Thermoplasmata archaeon]|nr:CoA-acylating methylmalonate-semialdehyde dehydrogenase [Thermoplasmata archaeon]